MSESNSKAGQKPAKNTRAAAAGRPFEMRNDPRLTESVDRALSTAAVGVTPAVLEALSGNIVLRGLTQPFGRPDGLAERVGALTGNVVSASTLKSLDEQSQRSTAIVEAFRNAALASGSVAQGLRDWLATQNEERQKAVMALQAMGVPVPLLRKESTGRVRTAADLGAVIRTARKAMGMNQAEFATHAGVGRRFVSELEGGKASLEFDRVMACAEAAGIDLVARRRGG